MPIGNGEFFHWRMKFITTIVQKSSILYLKARMTTITTTGSMQRVANALNPDR